jgi:Flp pilus assembly pilin Flp
MLKQFLMEESGMEMVEWAIVGILFAVAGAAGWGLLATEVGNALGTVQSTVQGN